MPKTAVFLPAMLCSCLRRARGGPDNRIFCAAAHVTAVGRLATSSRPRSRISCSRIRNFCTFFVTVIGKRVDEADVLRNLEVRDLAAAEVADLFRRRLSRRALSCTHASTVSPSLASGMPIT